MKLGVEIFAETIVSINPGNYFRLHLTSNHEPVPSFAGEDEYLFSGFVLMGKRVAASGRHKQYLTSGSFAGLGPWEAEGAELTWVEELLEKRIRLFLHTDLVQDRSLFLSTFGIKCVYGVNKEVLFDLPFCCPVLEVNELGPGKYGLELTELLRERGESLRAAFEKP